MTASPSRALVMHRTWVRASGWCGWRLPSTRFRTLQCVIARLTIVIALDDLMVSKYVQRKSRTKSLAESHVRGHPAPCLSVRAVFHSFPTLMTRALCLITAVDPGVSGSFPTVLSATSRPLQVRKSFTSGRLLTLPMYKCTTHWGKLKSERLVILCAVSC
jgi:hypothetical protein